MNDRINVLFIITDQLRADHLACYGNPDIKTPNIDALAEDGLRFTNSYCANPICMPNRSTIFTGKYPSIHGVRCNGVNLDMKIPTFTQTLRKCGYHTCSIGKIHLNCLTPPFNFKSKSVESIIGWTFQPKDKRPIIPKPYYGLDEVDLMVGHGDAVAGHYLDWLEERNPELVKSIKSRIHQLFEKSCYDTHIPEELYQTSYITEKTISFLLRFSEGYYENKPFFLHCSFPDPHHPVCPPGKYKDMYIPEDLNLSASFTDSLDAHTIIGKYLENAYPHSAYIRKTDEEEIRKFLAYTYGTISLIDSGMGQILAALSSFGLDKNTMVIFTSDHGEICGDHGIIFKGMVHYRGIINVPMIWKVPHITQPNCTTTSLASSIDIPLTILNLLNIDNDLHPPGMQGYDLTPILKDAKQKVRESCLIEEDEDFLGKKGHYQPPLRIRTLITENYRITIYQGRNDTGELYDLTKDPYECHNLWHDEESREIRFKLLNKLLHEIINVQNRYPKPISHG
jgi:arylsulfatase A-like enzyme